MAGDKIHWQFMLCTVLQERLDPDAMPLEGIQILHLEGHLGGNVLGLAVKAPIGHIVAGGRASHLQCRVNGLDAQRGDTVQFKILGPGAGPEGVQIRLVPHLKEPLVHLLCAVTLQPVSDGLLH